MSNQIQSIDYNPVTGMVEMLPRGGSPLATPVIDTRTPIQNLIINGNFDFAQRGVPQIVAANNGSSYFVDRFYFNQNAAATTAQATTTGTVPTLSQTGFNTRGNAALQIVNGSAVTNTTNLYQFIGYKMEGQDTAPIAGKAWRLSFWVNSSVAGIYTVSFVMGSRNYLVQYTITTANVYQKIVIDVPVDGAATPTLDNTTGLIIEWGLSAGASYQGTILNSWNPSGNNVGTSAMVQWGLTGGATFKMSQVMLIPGDFTSTPALDIPFQRAGRTIQQELTMCQRYYHRPFFDDTTSTQNRLCLAAVFSSTIAVGVLPLPVAMRVNPTVGSAIGNIALLANGSNVSLVSVGADGGTSGGNNNTASSVALAFTVASGLSVGQAVEVRFGSANSATNYIDFSAEL